MTWATKCIKAPQNLSNSRSCQLMVSYPSSKPWVIILRQVDPSQTWHSANPLIIAACSLLAVKSVSLRSTPSNPWNSRKIRSDNWMKRNIKRRSFPSYIEKSRTSTLQDLMICKTTIAKTALIIRLLFVKVTQVNFLTVSSTIFATYLLSSKIRWL